MSPSGSEFVSRDELLGGLPARRASTVLLAIEGRTARLMNDSRQAAARYVTEKTAEAHERAFLQALAQGRHLPIQPTIQDLEQYAPQWAALVPPDANLRAALARLLGEKYRFTAGVTPALRRALGLDDAAVQQAYRRLHGRPMAAIYARRLTHREQARWASARLAQGLENLPPFWTAYALTLTETVGASILALPIALAGIGPLAGVALLVVLGLVNVLTIAALAEAIVRNGNIRYGGTYFGRMVADYLGRTGSVVLTAALLVFIVLILIVYYVGVSVTLAAATGVPAAMWAALLFLVHLYFLRRETLNATIASALLIGAVNIGLILILSALALPHERAANLLHVDLPFVGGRPFDASILALIFGVILASYFGHTSVGNCAKVVLRRDPSGRGLVWGAVAAMATAVVLYCLWVIAVNGAVAPAVLARQAGTALIPLATTVGPLTYLFGTVYVILGMGMASIHVALALLNQVRDWLPARPPPPLPTPPIPGVAGGVRALVLSRGARFWLGVTPLAMIVVIIEWMLLTRQGSFARPYAFMGTITVSLLGGIFPMLMLAASRRKGEHVPGMAFRLLGHPILLVGIYLLFLIGVFLHGLVIWQSPLQRLAAVFVGGAVLGATVVLIRRGAFIQRVIVEVCADPNEEAQAIFTITANGKPAPADVRLRYSDGEQHIHAAAGKIAAHGSLLSATFELPATTARELKVWAHRITPEGDSEALPARLEVRCGATTTHRELSSSGGMALLPRNGTPCQVHITL